MKQNGRLCTFAKSSAFPRVPPSSSGKMLGSKCLCNALRSEPWKWNYNVDNTSKTFKARYLIENLTHVNVEKNEHITIDADFD